MSGSEQLVDQAARLVDRLRSLPESRLARRRDGEPTIAESAHALSQVLADLAADLGGEDRRDVPRLNDLASGDQVAVTARDLAAAVESTHGPKADVAVSVALMAVHDMRERID